MVLFRVCAAEKDIARRQNRRAAIVALVRTVAVHRGRSLRRQSTGAREKSKADGNAQVQEGLRSFRPYAQ